MKSRAFGAGWYITRARLVSKMATMSRRREIESELRECERQLKTIKTEGLGVPYTTTKVDTKDRNGIDMVNAKGVKLTRPSTPGDMFYEDLVSVYFVRPDGQRIQVELPLKWDNADHKKHLHLLQNMKAFNDWRYNVDSEFLENTYVHRGKTKKYNPEYITIHHLDAFGPRLGFAKFELKVTFDMVDPDDASKDKKAAIPGIVFCRGASVAMLVVLVRREDGARFTVLTVQPRIAVGKFAFPEIPAGMMDDKDNFFGVAAKELEEEAGIKINEKQMVNLTEFTYRPTPYTNVYPSAGGCDESMGLFACELAVSGPYIEWLSGKCTGQLAEGEIITLKIVPLADLPLYAPDMKALSALCLYERYKVERPLLTGLIDIDAQLAKKKAAEGAVSDVVQAQRTRVLLPLPPRKFDPRRDNVASKGITHA